MNLQSDSEAIREHRSRLCRPFRGKSGIDGLAVMLVSYNTMKPWFLLISFLVFYL
jgi:hypothetical protein